jgi:hypothetical protein
VIAEASDAEIAHHKTGVCGKAFHSYKTGFIAKAGPVLRARVRGQVVSRQAPRIEISKYKEICRAYPFLRRNAFSARVPSSSAGG